MIMKTLAIIILIIHVVVVDIAIMDTHGDYSMMVTGSGDRMRRKYEKYCSHAKCTTCPNLQPADRLFLLVARTTSSVTLVLHKDAPSLNLLASLN